jgi:hypothetical protein
MGILIWVVAALVAAVGSVQSIQKVVEGASFSSVADLVNCEKDELKPPSSSETCASLVRGLPESWRIRGPSRSRN